MDVLAGEELKNFLQHRFQEPVSTFLSGTYLPLVRPPVLWQGTSQLRIGGTGFVIVSGHLNLRNNLYMPLGRESQNFPDVLFGIVAAVGSRGSFFYEFSSHFILFPVPEFGLGTPGRQLRQPGIRIYLQPPARIVNQMKMETVHLQKRHHLQLFLHELFSLEMPAFVQQNPPIAETRPVQKGAKGHRAVQGREHLQGLPGIKHALLIGCIYLHAPFSYLQPVGRFQLPGGQILPFQMAPKGLFRNTDLLR